MQLLVSVSDGIEASAALSGGADIVDAKDPAAGPLGAVSLSAFDEIRRSVGDARPVTAALGDAHEGLDVESVALDFMRHGAQLVKVGFAGTASGDGAIRFLESAVRAATAIARERPHARVRPGVVAVAYADASRADSLPPATILQCAASAGARGVLLDTFDKGGPGLRELMTREDLAAWVRDAHHTGLLAAVAGRVAAVDLDWVRASGADIVGVRGAACEGGRTGRITAARVRHLRLMCMPNAERSERPERPERSTAGPAP